ncbi:hypothetical protein DFP93_105224 [Aneurinibacillus soli]|uniref:Uncharacterized protein n=1 Tax=Aneurinibacillus soli TaxID=1500254 RepID=A0A0U5B2L1_9BACL|nr:hypothetical protein [Aneurinibacillus soli]PYE62267.1 hypothetical protein DFP93_105224 [Aneurinibacillus soli]BAU28544.1 hypothetical protein CB4_02719 [Aneurinibacillus soli]
MAPRFSEYLDAEKKKQLNAMRKPKKKREPKQQPNKTTTENLSEREWRQLMEGRRTYRCGPGGAYRQRRS